ncbi:hypothetical protein ACVWZX_005067 [Deinococcus sp. UYEF24]
MVLKTQQALYFEDSEALQTSSSQGDRAQAISFSGASAFVPMILAGQPLSTLVMIFKEPHGFILAERRFLRVLAAQCALALGRIRHLDTTEQLVRDRTASLDAFVRFTEAAGTEITVPALAEQAVRVLRLFFPGCTTGYYELDEGRWKLRVHTEDLHQAPDLLERLKAGIPWKPQSSPTLSSPEIPSSSMAGTLSSKLSRRPKTTGRWPTPRCC